MLTIQEKKVRQFTTHCKPTGNKWQRRGCVWFSTKGYPFKSWSRYTGAFCPYSEGENKVRYVY